ncbi:MAG: hypothetical protein ACOYNL_11005, partial [Rickettsiales bacterium]
MTHGQQSGFTWGGALKGVAMIAGSIAAAIVVSSVAGYALTNVGGWLAAPVAGSTVTTAGAAAPWYVGVGTTMANLGATISGITASV